MSDVQKRRPAVSGEMAEGVIVRGPLRPEYGDILSEEALAFVADLVRTFRTERERCLAARIERREARRAGEPLDFLPETVEVRRTDWRVAELPAELLDRRVEITGPVDRKMFINGLNSGARVFMADFEDATSPTWDNLIQGQQNLRDAVHRTIELETGGKRYQLNPRTAVLMVRPRGWHLPERHVLVDGEEISGSLFDFGLFFFHNARELVRRGTAPYFYLPKMESYREARLWNQVFVHSQTRLGIPAGTVKATVLIETLPAAFQMDEILYELRDHMAGLNCGRWDYIFSTIKVRSHEPGAVLPDRAAVTMDKGFLRAYSELLIKTCHRRGALAMGGMAAFIPIKGDAAANDAAIEKVRADKLREVRAGHDGTWVAHPGLVPIAQAIFDEHMPTPNQLNVLRKDVQVGREELLAVPEGACTMAGLRHNIRVGIQYLEAWLRGLGCVPLYNLMEDAATAEISRTQVWQWLKHHAPVDGKVLTAEDVRGVIAEELGRIRSEIGDARFDSGRFPEARALFEELATDSQCAEFLTLPAYQQIVSITPST
jgi:malate synthase